MDIDAFKDKLADIFDIDEVNDADVLRDYPSWDSLAILSIVAMADSTYGFQMKAVDLKPLLTVADLCAYFEAHEVKHG